MLPSNGHESETEASASTVDGAAPAEVPAGRLAASRYSLQTATAWSCTLILLFVAASVAVHLAQPAFDPMDVALSFYMNGSLGWLLRVGLISLGAGSLLLEIAIGGAVHGNLSRTSETLLRFWMAGCIIGGVFAPDPFGQWSRPPSPSGLAHGFAALLAFVSFPCAALSLSRVRFAGGRPSALLRSVAAVCALMTVVLFLCFLPALRNRPPYAFGLVERVVLGSYVVWLLLANAAVRRVSSTQAR